MELLQQEKKFVAGRMSGMSACHDVVSLCEVNADGREQMQLYTSTGENALQ